MQLEVSTSSESEKRDSHEHIPGCPIDGKKQSIDLYQSIKLVNWYRLYRSIDDQSIITEKPSSIPIDWQVVLGSERPENSKQDQKTPKLEWQEFPFLLVPSRLRFVLLEGSPTAHLDCFSRWLSRRTFLHFYDGLVFALVQTLHLTQTNEASYGVSGNTTQCHCLSDGTFFSLQDAEDTPIMSVYGVYEGCLVVW